MNKIHCLKSAIICLLISVSFSFWSCNEAQNEVPSPSCDHNHAVPVTITAETAVKIGINALNRLKYGDEGLQSRANELTAKEVRKYPESSRSTQRQCYIVNFEEGGFAVVAPNGEVLAMNEAGAFSPEEYEPDNFFMDLALNYVNNPDLLNGGLEPDPVPFDSTATLEPAFIWHNGHRCGLKINPLLHIERFKLLKTNWSQNYPYNNLCPIINGIHAPVGCVPLAAAQIMTYHKKPASYMGYVYHWDLMENFPDIWDDTPANDIAQLCRQLGILAETYYDLDGSATDMVKMKNALIQIGYTNTTILQGYNEDLILNEVLNDKPIMISAKGTKNENDFAYHAWVIDGAFHNREEYVHTNLDNNTLCYTSTHKTTYFHCNWGWGMSNDKNEGYYLSNVFDPLQYNFYYYYHIIYNIY